LYRQAKTFAQSFLAFFLELDLVKKLVECFLKEPNRLH